MISKNAVPKRQSPIKLSVKHMARDSFLIYRLYEEAIMDGSRENAVFSLSVTMISCMGMKRRQAYFTDISRSKSDAARLFKIISRGLVTPTVAEEILADLIGTDV